METLTVPRTPAEIRAAAEAFRATNPKARIRNVAAGVGVSEAELLATRCGTPEVARLRCAPADLLSELAPLGPLMALTRNDACVHEKTGVYANPEMSADGKGGLFNNEDVDLRLFFRAWHLAFYVHEDGRRSVQFFDRDGEAVHKVYAAQGTDVEAMEALAARYAHADQSDVQPVAPVTRTPETPLEELDGAAFLAGWRALEDTHDFFPLLRTHGVSRRQAVHLAGEHAPELARRVANDAHRRVLEGAAATGLPVMVFVGSRGCVQIHTGPVSRLVETGPWYNVLDPSFNLHLNETSIAESWVVVKPTADGPVTSLELFDADGGLIVQVFGKRKPGLPELAEWRALAGTL
jgi:putative hemin transport protein